MVHCRSSSAAQQLQSRVFDDQFCFPLISILELALIGFWGGGLKDPLIFGQCIYVGDVAVLLNRNSYVEQYD